jgi:hypothetical protein
VPLNPFTGEFEGYDSPSTAAGMGMSALSVAGIETPLAYRMLENMPGIAASIGFSSMRGANTIMYGGYKQGKAPKFIGRKARREAAAAAGKSPILRPMIASNNPFNPRNLRRYRDQSIFDPASSGKYTPFAAAGMLGKTKFVKERLAAKGVDLVDGESALSGGLLSAISAGTRMDRLEQKAFNGSQRAARRLDRIHGSVSGFSARGGAPTGSGAALGVGVSQVGAAGNTVAASMGAAGTAAIAGYFRGALGYADAGGFTGKYGDQAQKFATRAKTTFENIMSSDDMAKYAGRIKYDDLARGGKGMLRGIGLGGTAKFATSGGAKFMAARGIGLAIPGLQVVAAASLIYDIGKMGGEIVKSSINLARDASRSMQGSLAKPIFGMGYRDSEAAATSRARGVMAISNSRLNARSVLGSEAAQLAAYYG